MKIAIFSGSRADAGALTATKEALDRAGVLTHWFNFAEATLRTESRLSVALSAAGVCSGFALELHDMIDPDLVLLHGDRYEVLGAAMAAFLLGYPIAHLGGGDITEGSQDDSIRHAITKLSHLHFATCEDSARRLVQLGESPDRVFNVGDPGIDIFFNGEALISKWGVLKTLCIGAKHYFLISYHPNTLGDTEAELTVLMNALRRSLKLMPDVALILLEPNKDAGHLMIEKNFQALVSTNVRYMTNMPRDVYLSILKHATALIGNSSAAFYEAPSCGTHVINFGDRQKGRETAENWLATVNTADEIITAMKKAYNTKNMTPTGNPYGDGLASQRIANILRSVRPKELLRKSFRDSLNEKDSLSGEPSCLTKFGKRYTPNELGEGTPKKNSSDGLPVTIFEGQCVGQCNNDQIYASLTLGAAQAQAPGFWLERALQSSPLMAQNQQSNVQGAASLPTQSTCHLRLAVLTPLLTLYLWRTIRWGTLGALSRKWSVSLSRGVGFSRPFRLVKVIRPPMKAKGR